MRDLRSIRMLMTGMMSQHLKVVFGENPWHSPEHPLLERLKVTQRAGQGKFQSTQPERESVQHGEWGERTVILVAHERLT